MSTDKKAGLKFLESTAITRLYVVIFIAMFTWAGTYIISTTHANPAPTTPNCSRSSMLVNPCRPLIGAAVHGNPGIPGKTAPAKDGVSQFDYLEQLIGQKLDVYRDYHAVPGEKGNVDSSSPLDPSTPAGQYEYKLASEGVTLDINWDVSSTWAQAMPVNKGGSATVNATIDQVATNIKKFGHPIFLSPWHEANLHVSATDNSSEDCSSFNKTTGDGTPDQFVAAWQNIYSRFKADGVTKVVWVLNVGTYGVKNCWVPYMWPGTNEVDWVIYDTYSRDKDWAQTSGQFYNYLSSLASSSNSSFASVGTAIASKPWGIGEFGDGNASSPSQADDYFNSITTAVKANTYPKLKMYLIFADTGNNAGPGALTDYDPATTAAPNGTYDPTKQNDINALFDAILAKAPDNTANSGAAIGQSPGSQTGLSGMAVAVLCGVGAVIVLIVGLLLYFLYRRRQNRSEEANDPSTTQHNDNFPDPNGRTPQR